MSQPFDPLQAAMAVSRLNAAQDVLAKLRPPVLPGVATPKVLFPPVPPVNFPRYLSDLAGISALVSKTSLPLKVDNALVSGLRAQINLIDLPKVVGLSQTVADLIATNPIFHVDPGLTAALRRTAQLSSLVDIEQDETMQPTIDEDVNDLRQRIEAVAGWFIASALWMVRAESAVFRYVKASNERAAEYTKFVGLLLAVGILLKVVSIHVDLPTLGQ